MKRTRNVSIKSYMSVDNLISVKMEGFCTGAMCTFQTYKGKPMFGIYHILIGGFRIRTVHNVRV
jgi:hypothetical protein